MRNIFFKLPEPDQRRNSWLLVLLFSLLIFCTIPLARMIQGMFEAWLGRRAYFVAAAIMGIFIAIVVGAYIFRRRKRRILRRLGWMALLLGGATWVIRNQLQTPAEAIHFFQYGILSFLLFRAWSHHVTDRLIYPIAFMSLLVIASLDEFLQWMMPGRYWDFRDIRLNAMAGLFIQGIIALVINPSGIQIRVQPASVRLLCKVSLLTLLCFGAAISNTPARVDIYATRIPFMRFLHNNQSVMTEYGFRHRDPQIGIFYSRLPMSELIRLDRERGAEVGEVVRRYRSLVDYREFLSLFSASTDPLLHEFRVHLYRRDHYLSTAGKHLETDPARFVHHLTVAYRENQLLEKYFTTALVASGMVWSRETLALASGSADLDVPYTSPVSDHLVTMTTELELWIILFVLIILLTGVYLRYGRDPSPSLE